MARKLITSTFCDVCLANGEEREAVFSGTVRVANLTKTLELCDEHQTRLLTPIEEAMNRYGTRETPQGNVTPIYRGRGTKKATRGLECTEPGCEDGPFKAPQGLAAHMRLRHGISAADRKAAAH